MSMSKLVASCISMAANVMSAPPVAIITAIGVKIRAKIISEACTVSVQLTARNPPIKV
ncbi:hypothetical protein D3C84_1083480 [compost metagenome]